MRRTLLRILKHGILAAAILAVVGFVLAEIAGVYLGTLPPARGGADPTWADNITSDLRRRMPLGMALWGFGLVAVFELLGWLVRGNPLPPTAKPTTPDPAAELWKQLERGVEAAPPRRDA